MIAAIFELSVRLSFEPEAKRCLSLVGESALRPSRRAFGRSLYLSLAASG